MKKVGEFLIGMSIGCWIWSVVLITFHGFKTMTIVWIMSSFLFALWALHFKIKE